MKENEAGAALGAGNLFGRALRASVADRTQHILDGLNCLLPRDARGRIPLSDKDGARSRA